MLPQVGFVEEIRVCVGLKCVLQPISRVFLFVLLKWSKSLLCFGSIFALGNVKRLLVLLFSCSPADLLVVDVKVSAEHFCFHATAAFYLQHLLIANLL